MPAGGPANCDEISSPIPVTVTRIAFRRALQRFEVIPVIALCGLLNVSVLRASEPESPIDLPPVDVLIVEGEQLLAAGRSKEGFRLLGEAEERLAGNPRFDFAFALLAMDSGWAAPAIRALRRVIAQTPGFWGAELEFGRALAMNGDVRAARELYGQLLAREPPPLVASSAREGLKALANQKDARWQRWTPSVELAAGYDSNVNFSTSDPTFLGFALDPRFVRDGSPFVAVGGAISNSRPIREAGRWSNRLLASSRSNPEARFADETNIVASTVYSHATPRLRTALLLGGGYSWIEGEPNRRGVSAELALTRNFDQRWELAALGRVGLVDYLQPELEVLDVLRLLNGVSLSRIDLGSGAGRIGVAAIGGRDLAKLADSSYSADRYGARLFGSWTMARFELYAEASYFVADYFDGGGFLGIDRLDRQLGAVIGASLAGWPRPGWRLAPRASWVRNDSNLSFFAYDQAIVSVALSYEFARD